MSRSTTRILPLLPALLLAGASTAAEPIDLSGYRTVDQAIPAAPMQNRIDVGRARGYVGVSLATDSDGRIVARDVAADSPAAAAGVQRGDVLARADGRPISDLASVRSLFHSREPGDRLTLEVQRKGRPQTLQVAVGAVSNPISSGYRRPLLGVEAAKNEKGPGVVVRTVAPASPADLAKIRVGDSILKFDGAAINDPDALREAIAKKRPDEQVGLTLLLAGRQVESKVRLAGETQADARRRGGRWERPGMGYWKKEKFRLAVVVVDYPDVKHNPKIDAKAWEDAMFSVGAYKATATGQTAYGSLADYYLEQSYGKLKVVGKAFAPVEVSKKRPEYGQQGSNRFELLTEALDRLEKREGANALANFDGVVFLYSGGRMQVPRGSLYWPHRASVSHKGKRWPYYICPEGGARMANISVFCHEFGHMLGLPDLYARPENPGSEGAGIWCAMSNQAPNGRPQHFSAWSKEKLGWIQPKEIDPSAQQKLVLGAIEDSPKECLRIKLRPDGSEYLLLENRRRKGFDVSLPAEGLLIWRVVANRPVLEESHGVQGPAGPRMFLTSVPYPSAANDAFTPFTTPSSRSQLGGGAAVFITNIRRAADGRIAFQIGSEYQ